MGVIARVCEMMVGGEKGQLHLLDVVCNPSVEARKFDIPGYARNSAVIRRNIARNSLEILPN